MLDSQYLGWGHQARLKAIIDGNEHTHQGHQCFSAAHITLQQAVHLLPRTHIPPDLFQYLLLGPCEFEGQVVLIKAVKLSPQW